MRRPSIRPRWLLGMLVVGALVAAAVWPRATEVEVASVERGPLTVSIDEDGETRVRDRFVVTSPVSGEVLRIQLRPGDVVRRGTTVAVVRPAAPMPLDARSRAEAAALVLSASDAFRRLEAERNRTQAVFERAKRMRDLAQSLFKGGAVARDELDARDVELRSAEEAARAAEFAVAQASHDVDAARARIEPQPRGPRMRDAVITAPVDGVVLRRHLESQAVVAAGAPLVEIGDPARLEIVSDLLSADAVRVQPGTQVLIEQWGGPDTLRGRVRRVEPSGFTKISALGVEEQRVNVIIDFEAPSEAASALGDGFRVEVRIVTWQADNVLQVSPGTLFRQGDTWATYLVENGRAHLRQVRVGARSDTEVQILEGLEQGAQVVLYPPDTLGDGTRVAPRTR